MILEKNLETHKKEANRILEKARETQNPNLTREAFNLLYLAYRKAGVQWWDIKPVLRRKLQDSRIPFNQRRGYFNMTAVDDTLVGYTPDPELEKDPTKCPLDFMSDGEIQFRLREEQEHIDEIRRKELNGERTGTMPSWYWQQSLDDDRKYLLEIGRL